MILSDYKLVEIGGDTDVGLFRAYPRGGSDVLLMRMPNSGNMEAASLALQNEYGLRSLLDPLWAVRPLSLQRSDGQVVLLLDDPGGVTLDRVFTGPLEEKVFLTTALKLTAAIGKAHMRGITHCDIRPANILVDEAGQVRITGFGFAFKDSGAGRLNKSATPKESSFAYISPELTGRTSWDVDARSDLYSLGVMLYQLLCGSLPFSADDPSEWFHSHLARQPPPPSERHPGITRQIEMIVLKLLAKNPRERYQTADGLSYDLKRCLDALSADSAVTQFPLGERDLTERLRAPDRLFGRAVETQLLVAAFDRVRSTGAPEIVMLGGASGIGKSALVRETERVLAATPNLFVNVKFESDKNDFPYFKLFQSFRLTVQKLIAGNDNELLRWRDLLMTTLGSNISMIVEQIPELGLIVGHDSSEVVEVAPQNRQNRFNLVFRQFVSVLARPEAPLVLSLDDLQWADPGTLQLLTTLMTEDEVRHLLVVGSYRDNEVGPSHQLAESIAAIKAKGCGVHEILLAPLSPDHSAELIAEALGTEVGRVRKLTDLVYGKTAGNPFFAFRFVSGLAEKHLLVFDTFSNSWTWNPVGLDDDTDAKNVAELLSETLTRTEPATTSLLVSMSLLGFSAHSRTLATLSGRPEAEVLDFLALAVQAGLVTESGNVFAFAHDQVHAAVYALVREEERAAAHLTVGRSFLSTLDAAAIEANLFEIVGQINKGASAAANVAERRSYADLNLRACANAKRAAAFQSAFNYAVAGLAFLSTSVSPGQADPLQFELELNRAEAEAMLGDFASAEPRVLALVENAEDETAYGNAVKIGITLYLGLWKIDRAIDLSLRYFRRIGLDWSRHPTTSQVDAEYNRMWQLIGSREIPDLKNLPLMSDERHMATLEVLATVQTAAFEFSDRNLWLLMMARMVNMTLEHGLCDASTSAFSCMPIALGVSYGMFDSGYQFGKLAFDLVEGRNLIKYRARVYAIYGATVLPWTGPLRESIGLNRRASDASLQAGDPLYSIWSRSMVISSLIASGAPLLEVQKEAEIGFRVARKVAFGYLADPFTTVLRFALVMRGVTPSFTSFSDVDFNEAAFEEYLETEPAHLYGSCPYYIRKMQARYLAGQYADAVEAGVKATDAFQSVSLMVERVEYHFYAALSKIAVDRTRNHSYSDQIAEHLRNIEQFAADRPDNYADRANIIRAELSRDEGDYGSAEKHYDMAIDAARSNGFVQNEAVAHELAARHYSMTGNALKMQAHLRDARTCYARWGAAGKVRQLDEEFLSVRHRSPPLKREGQAPLPARDLDISTVIKVSEAISGEIDLRRLIQTLMIVTLEHSGGERALLILPSEDEFVVEAEALAVRDEIDVGLRSSPLSFAQLPESVFRYVVRSHTCVIVEDTSKQNPFIGDHYIQNGECKSLLCLPLLRKGELVGVIYIENKSIPHAFNSEGTSLLMLVASQAATSIQHAKLYADLQSTKANLEESQRITKTGSFVFYPDSRILYWSDEIYRIFEFSSRSGITMDIVGEFVVSEDLPSLELFFGNMPHDGKPHTFEYRIRVASGEIKVLKITAHSERDDAGALKLVGTKMDVTEAKLAAEKLNSSISEMSKLAALIESSTDMVCFSQTPNGVEFINLAGRLLIGLEAEADTRIYSLADLLSADQKTRFEEIVLPALYSNGHWEGETELKHLVSGALIPVHQTIFLVAEPETGRRAAIACIYRDISERKKLDSHLAASLDEKDALLKEVHHRVKNNLQLISSLLNLQAGKITDPSVVEKFQDSRNRVRTMALVHENLYRAGDFSRVAMSSHIRGLCAQLFSAYRLSNQRVELECRVDEIELDLDRAVSIGLIINELVSNALKHAFPDSREGTISVELKGLEEGKAYLEVEDDGVGFETSSWSNLSNSFGLQLVEDLTAQIAGVLTVDGARGAVFRIEFDLTVAS